MDFDNRGCITASPDPAISLPVPDATLPVPATTPQATPSPVLALGSLVSEIAPPPHGRTSPAMECNTPRHSGRRRASHADRVASEVPPRRTPLESRFAILQSAVGLATDAHRDELLFTDLFTLGSHERPQLIERQCGSTSMNHSMTVRAQHCYVGNLS